MPIYEYKCQKCQQVFDFIQKVSDAPKKKCEACGGKLEKLVSNPSFQLKGTGWYKTDYAAPSSTKNSDKKAEKKDSASESKESKESKKEVTSSNA